MVQEIEQHVLGLVEIGSVIFVVEDQRRYAKIPRRGECKVMPLDVHEEICVAGLMWQGRQLDW